MSKYFFTPNEATRQGAPENVIQHAQNTNRKVLKVVWDRESGYPEHAWGYVQWSVRPFHQCDGCDGTIDENVHLIGYRLCQQLGIDYAAAMDEAYAWQNQGNQGDWIRDTPNSIWGQIEAETVIPPLSGLALQRLLYDLGDINNRSLIEVLEKKFSALGYDVSNWWNCKFWRAK